MPRRPTPALALVLSFAAACGKRDAAPFDPPSASAISGPASSVSANAIALPAASADAAAPSPAPSVPRPAARQACHVKFHGAEETEATSAWSPGRRDNDATAASDYWATDAEVRTAIRASIKGKDRAAADREIDERMQRDPRLVILAIECILDHGVIAIVSSDSSKYADIPFKPGTYKLGTGTAKTAPAGDFAVARLRSGTSPYIDVKPGTITLTKFDGTGVAGSFSFDATSARTKAPAKIEGTFDMPCEPNRFGRCQIGG